MNMKHYKKENKDLIGSQEGAKKKNIKKAFSSS